jgi:hypothetical protein
MKVLEKSKGIARFLALVAILAFVPACNAPAIGVNQDPKTGVVTIDPSGGTVGQIIATAGQAAPFIPQPFGGILTLATLGASAILHVIQMASVKDWKGAALATAQGVNDVVSHLDTKADVTPLHPAVVADMIKQAVDTAHDGAGVPQPIQAQLAVKT